MQNKNYKKWHCRGQSLLEYLIILCGIVLAFIAAKSYIQTSVETALNTAGDAIADSASAITR